jgi:hypothetical protein
MMSSCLRSRVRSYGCQFQYQLVIPVVAVHANSKVSLTVRVAACWSFSSTYAATFDTRKFPEVTLSPLYVISPSRWAAPTVSWPGNYKHCYSVHYYFNITIFHLTAFKLMWLHSNWLRSKWCIALIHCYINDATMKSTDNLTKLLKTLICRILEVPLP